MTRQVWKIYYRQIRIARREATKVFKDMFLFGIGISKNGMHVDILSDEAKTLLNK